MNNNSYYEIYFPYNKKTVTFLNTDEETAYELCKTINNSGRYPHSISYKKSKRISFEANKFRRSLKESLK